MEQAIAIGLFANFLGIMALLWKISRFISHIEFKVDLMWSDYTARHDIRPKERRNEVRA